MTILIERKLYMGYITSKQLNQNEALTGPARQEQIDKARIKELEEQLLND